MYKLVIFDIDGTLVECKSGATFRKSADDWRLLPGRVEKLQELKVQGVRLALATNQGGVAFGYMEESDILRELHLSAKALGVPPGGVYICYMHPKAKIERYKGESYRRKPDPGMLLEAMSDFESLPDKTLYVGDRPEDEDAARNAGVAFQWADLFFSEQEKQK